MVSTANSCDEADEGTAQSIAQLLGTDGFVARAKQASNESAIPSDHSTRLSA